MIFTLPQALQMPLVPVAGLHMPLVPVASLHMPLPVPHFATHWRYLSLQPSTCRPLPLASPAHAASAPLCQPLALPQAQHMLPVPYSATHWRCLKPSTCRPLPVASPAHAVSAMPVPHHAAQQHKEGRKMKMLQGHAGRCTMLPLAPCTSGSSLAAA